MKKLFILLLALIMAVGIAACGSTSSTQPEEAAQEETPEAVEEVVEDAAPLTPQEEIEAWARETLESKRYLGVVIDSIEVNENLGTDAEGDYILLAYVTFDMKNKADTALNTISLQAEDFAALTGTEQPDVSEVVTTRMHPFTCGDQNFAYRLVCQRSGDGMTIVDKLINPLLQG